MKINRNNYEPFFLDFLEGNLEEDQIDQFLDFLEQNPDLKEELQLFESIHLPEEQIVYPGKKELYKSAADVKQAAENQIIAYLEGDMEDEKRRSFEAWLGAHPELQKEYKLYAQTRLIADRAIKYPEKHKLYRKSGKTIVLNWISRVAAVVVLLWGIDALYRNPNEPIPQKQGPEIAELKPKAEPSVKQMDREKKSPETEVPMKTKPAKETKPVKTKSIREQTKGRLEEKKPVQPKPEEKDLKALAFISPIHAQLKNTPSGIQLAVSHASTDLATGKPDNVMSVDEFLASRAKKVGNEGLVSAKRIARTGLGLVSELSGDMIGYTENEGKITSVDFETKILAFSIPLKKK